MIYEKLRNPNRQWGYWLTRRGHQVEDEGGRVFWSVRHAFWSGRLGMPVEEHRPQCAGRLDRSLMEVELDRMGECLAAIDRKHCGSEELATEVFSDEPALARFYLAWLEGHNLVALRHLTAEGHAVLAMLGATGGSGLSYLAAADRARPSDPADRDGREAFFRKIAAIGDRQRFRFTRMAHGGSAGVELVADAPDARQRRDATMDVGRIVWAQTFSDGETRDRFFHWLCVRVDRWDAWGSIAYESGGQFLAQRLLALLVHEATGTSPSEGALVRLDLAG